MTTIQRGGPGVPIKDARIGDAVVLTGVVVRAVDSDKSKTVLVAFPRGEGPGDESLEWAINKNVECLVVGRVARVRVTSA